MRLKFLLFFSFASCLRPGQATFTSVSPKLVKPNSNYVAHVTLEPTATVDYLFTLSINSSEIDEYRPALLYTSIPVTIQPGKTAEIEVITKALPLPAYNLTLRGYPVGSTQQDAGYELSSTVYKNTKYGSLLIQTDKVIYKPKDVVNFRVVMFCNKLRPLNGSVNVTITDPQRNIIKFSVNQEVSNGIFSSNFKLSDEPNLGDWRIKVESTDDTTYQSFTVDQYVLPKFNVQVIIPKFVTYNASQFRAEIKASYTYGKPIEGEVEVRLSEKQSSYYHTDRPVVLKTSILSGSTFVDFNIATELNQKPLNYEKQFHLVATVRDKVTGKKQNGTATLSVYPYPYKIEIIEAPRNYKPGFPLEIKFKVSTQDDIPIEDQNSQALQIQHGFACNAEDAVVYYPIPANGIVAFRIVTPTNELVSTNSIKVTYKDYTFHGYPPSKHTTPSKVYMQVTLNSKSPEVGSKLEVTIQTNKAIEAVNYLVVGRAQILSTGRQVVVNGPQKRTSFELVVPQEASPEAKLVVYTVIAGSQEVVAESIVFNSKPVLENSLNITLSKDIGEPGSSVRIGLATQADSLIALRGVDQSVLLLKEDRDITLKTVQDEIQAYQNQVNVHRNWGGSQSYQAFEESGVIVLTNGELDKPTRYPVQAQSFLAGGASNGVGFGSYSHKLSVESSNRPVSAVPAPVRDTTATVGSPAAQGEIRVRKEFPETWLWEEIQANDSLSLDKVIPDTITSWYISGYALSPSTGLGVSNGPVILKTFRPFFLSLNVPYAVVKGEIFPIQVLVHNYMEINITAEITLKNSQAGFEFLELTDKLSSEAKKTIEVPGNSVQSLKFIVKPIKFGLQPLDVTGITINSGSVRAGDAISKPIPVKPPGQKQTLTQSLLLDLRNINTTKSPLTVQLPPDRVPDADTLKFSIISDLLGSTISNLDSLLKMPTGCGEQNLVHFVPDVVILQYLEASGTLTPEIKAKAIRYLESGYQRQLSYKRDDGSFSAFGKRDSFGSTWLTAFVVRSFVSAKPYITVDDRVLIEAINFLSSKQQSDGSFVEHGTVFQQDLKGGAVESLSVSAYVTLCLLESSQVIDNAEALANVTVVKAKALEFIAQPPKSGFDDPYAAALVTYTLQVAGHSGFGKYKQVLDSLAKQDSGLKYWEPRKVIDVNSTVNGTSDVVVKQPWIPRLKPVSVEMTAYALLVYLKEGNLDEVLPIGKWLLQQRSESGGFISTQDTVVGLTALAKFATATTSRSPNLKVNLTYETGSQQFFVNTENQIVLQEATLPRDTKVVTVVAEGSGSALVQLVATYYVENRVEFPAFSLTLKKEEQSPVKIKLDICAVYNEKNKESNMAILEVNLPSGFTFDVDHLEGLKTTVDKLKRYELEEGNSQVNLYLSRVYYTVPTCFSVVGNREFKVANPVKAYVQIYDYYDTTLRAREFYDPTNLSACDLCIGDDSCAIARENCVNT